jgi:hypothetical protein
VNSFIKYIPESLKDQKAFVELLLSIIDTKIQFAKHRTHALISSFSNTPVTQDDYQSVLLENFSLDLGDAPTESGIIYSLIEKYSKTTYLLFQLRKCLSHDNVSIVYDLLCNDKFMLYDSEELNSLLKENVFKDTNNIKPN